MIKVRSKTLFIPAEEQSIGAVGEADSTVREFHIDRVSGDGVDLANLLFKLNIRYAGVREIDRSDLEKIVTDNAIILRWLISSVTLRNAGTAFLQLDAFDETGSCRWKSYPGAVYIEKSLGNAEIPSNTLSELEQLEKKFAKVGEGESSRVEAEKKRVIAEEKRVTAEGKREEAEARRNTSLSNIVAEEEKIIALSKETKGYRDSVASDKASVEAVKANVQELKADTENIKTSTLSAVETVKTEINRDMATAKNKLNDTIALAVTELHNTLFVARNDLGGMVSEGTEIKGEINTLKSEVNTVKEEAINAKNEAVTAKNGASTVKEEITAIKVEISASAEKAKQNADKAESSANMAKTAETNAEAFKTEAGKSAEKAKESETKTLEALAKAQEGGKVAGVTTEEMHSYVDTAVGKVKSGITEAEAIAVVGSELKKKEVPENDYKDLAMELITAGTSTIENLERTTLVDGETLSKALSGVAKGVRAKFVDINALINEIGSLIAPHVVQMIDDKKMVEPNDIVEKLVEKFNFDEKGDVFPYGKLATTGGLNALHSALKKAVVSPLKEQRRKQGTPYRDIADLYDMQGASTVDVVKEINKRIREDNYGDIRLGDYINVKLKWVDKPMKFVAVGIDFYKGIKAYPDSENPQKMVVEKVPLKHIDFVCIDTDLTLGLQSEEAKPSSAFTNRETRCFVSALVCKSLIKGLREDNLDFFNELAYKPCVDWPKSFSLGDKPYTFMTHLPLWVPTPEEVTGKYMTFKNDGNISIDSSKMALQYPYFAEHPEAFDDGYHKGAKPKIFSLSYDEKVTVHIINGYFIGMPATKVFENVKGSDQIYIPLGFRLDGKQSNGSIIPPA